MLAALRQWFARRVLPTFGHVCSTHDVDLAVAIAPHGDGVVARGRHRDGGRSSRTQRCSSSNGSEVSPFQDALLGVERADECDMAEDQAHFILMPGAAAVVLAASTAVGD